MHKIRKFYVREPQPMRRGSTFKIDGEQYQIIEAVDDSQHIQRLIFSADGGQALELHNLCSLSMLRSLNWWTQEMSVMLMQNANADVEELDMKAPEKPIKYGGGGDDADAAQPNQQLDAADEAESAT